MGVARVILTSKVHKLGNIGDAVSVRAGYARHYLLPMGKALPATKDNLRVIQEQIQQLHKVNMQHKHEAIAIAEQLQGKSFNILRHTGEAGHLYGSVSAADIVKVINEVGYNLHKSQIVLHKLIKTKGSYDVRVELHAEVMCDITVVVDSIAS